MTHFEKKSLIWLLAGSLVLAGSAMAWRVAATGSSQAHDALHQVEKSQADFDSLKARLSLWESTHPEGTAAQGGVLHIEPVALTADFTPQEFSGIGTVLAGMYTKNGSLNLKSFVIDFKDGNAHLAVLGDKAFVQ